MVVDDHAMVRFGLIKLLRDEPDMRVIAEAECHSQLISKLNTIKPDVILLDISMPGRNGLESLREVKFSHPNVRVIMLSMHSEEHYGVRAVKSGASGYLTKNLAAEELVKAIRLVNGGKKYVTPALADKLAHSIRSDSDVPRHETLSNREFQVFSMIASGKTFKEIATELSLSPASVATYRTRVLDKLNLSSCTQLVNYAHRNNLVD